MPVPRILAVITARGGSKGVHRKNIRPLAGKPLLAWTIESAQHCRTPLHGIILSTEDEEIAAVGRACGAEVPFMRPKEMAVDTAKSLPVIQHATRFVEERDNVRMDWVLLLQPTSPLRLPEDIDTAITLADSGCDSVVSVTEMAEHPIFAKKIDDTGMLHPFLPDTPEGIRRQDVYPLAYMNNGAIYLVRRDVLMERNSLYGKRSRAYVMPPARSVNIDTEADFRQAEALVAESCAA